MNRYLSCLTTGILALALSCVAIAQDDPLEGLEEVHPAVELELPEAVPSENFDAESIARGKYLVTLLRCAGCHTDGALIGEPRDDRLLAGSTVGIAYTNPMENARPGVVYPPNLTPDPETGLGGWETKDIVRMIRKGTDHHGRPAIAVMPSAAYYALTDEDALAIAAYLKSLPPVHHAVPDKVMPGEAAPSRYVHFGVYRSME